jgi:Domain of unknown function (DUF4440)
MEIPAENFTTTLPDIKLRDKTQFLQMIAARRPFADLKADDVKIRLLGDFAIIHAHIIFRTLYGVERQGRYIDDSQRRGGRRPCVAANVVAEGQANGG